MSRCHNRHNLFPYSGEGKVIFPQIELMRNWLRQDVTRDNHLAGLIGNQTPAR